MESVNVKTAITLFCLAVVLVAVCLPLYLGKIKMNSVYGFRTRKAFQSAENWYRINKYGAKAVMCWSVVIMATGITCLFIHPLAVLPVTKIAFVSVLVPLLLTLYYSRRL